MIVYVLVGIWNGLAEDIIVYAEEERAKIAERNLRKKYGRNGCVTLEKKEVIEHGA